MPVEPDIQSHRESFMATCSVRCEVNINWFLLLTLACKKANKIKREKRSFVLFAVAAEKVGNNGGSHELEGCIAIECVDGWDEFERSPGQRQLRQLLDPEQPARHRSSRIERFVFFHRPNGERQFKFNYAQSSRQRHLRVEWLQFKVCVNSRLELLRRG